MTPHLSDKELLTLWQKVQPDDDLLRKLVEEGGQMLTVQALPEKHRMRMRSTNILEKWVRDIRRRTNVVKTFPTKAL